MLAPALMAACAEAGVAISFLTRTGRFMARVAGFTPGNVLLRRTQYRWADDEQATARIARCVVLGKIANARHVLLRTARETSDEVAASRLQTAAVQLAQSMHDLEKAANTDVIRGIEGDASRVYFTVFNDLISHPSDEFRFNGRSRRPPLNNVNSLLSFVYAMLTHDARSACEAGRAGRSGGFSSPGSSRAPRPGTRPDRGVSGVSGRSNCAFGVESATGRSW